MTDNFVTLTRRDSVEARCIVLDKNVRYEFNRFITIGFVDATDEEVTIVAAYLAEVGTAINTLKEVFERGMESASPEVREEVLKRLDEKGEKM